MRLRRPRLPGTHRTLAWLAFWILPVGLAAAAAMPSRRVALLHLVFIGGFSLMTFAVATHVIASHGGYESLLTRPSRVVRAVGLLVLAGMATRVAADFLPGRAHWSHLAFAAAAWIVALAAWMAFLVPKAIRPIRRNDGGPALVQVALPHPTGSPRAPAAPSTTPPLDPR